MMFRSLLFVSPLVSWADEQTAMLQLNRRGQLSESAANDLLVTSMEKTLLSKDDKKTNTTDPEHKDQYIQIHKLAKCRFHLKSKHAVIKPTAPAGSSALLEQMYASKGKDKTHELIQRAVAAVGEDNFRTFEMNLVGKDEENATKAVEYKKSRMTPCEVLDQLKYAFELNLNDVEDIRLSIPKTAENVTTEIQKLAEKAFDDGEAQHGQGPQKIVLAMLPFKLDKEVLNEVITQAQKERELVTKAIEPMLEKIKGSEMHTKIEAAFTHLKNTIESSETAVRDKLQEDMKGITGHAENHTAPAAFDEALFKFGFKEPKAWPALSKSMHMTWTQQDQDDIIAKVADYIKNDKQNLKADVYSNTNGLKGFLEKIIYYHYGKHQENVWSHIKMFWQEVLNTPTEPAEDFRVKNMMTPPKCVADRICQLDHDLFWEQASGYLEVTDPSNASRPEYEVETECTADAYDQTKPLQFEPRRICEGRHGHHVQLECVDEFVYLAKKHGNTSLTESCEAVNKIMFFDSDKLRDADKPHVQECFEQGKKKGNDCTKFQFMQFNDGETCKTVEDLKHACRVFDGKAKKKDDKQMNRMAH